MSRFLFLLALLLGCKDQHPQRPGPKSDTTMVLQVALQTAFMEHKLPETSSLYRGHLFSDSIFVVTDSLPRRFFPDALDTIKFEFGSHQQFIDRLRNIHDTLKPNYLYVCCLERSDSGYSISIQSRSIVRFGGGGSTLIDVIKQGDSMVLRHFMSGSIN